MMLDAATAGMLKVDRIELLKFFDVKDGASKGDATGIVAVAGEDLNAACFRHYVECKSGRATVLEDPVTTGRQRGPRLDRWIEVQWGNEQESLYQTEIKNYSASAIGGETLAVKACEQDVNDYKQRRWERQWDSERGTLKHPHTAKVLVPMNKLDGYAQLQVKPLVIFWEALGPKEHVKKHLFSVPVTYDFPFDWPSSWTKSGEFDHLWVFSVSSYLRSLKEPTIQLPMPHAARRIQTLNRLFS